MDCEDESSRSSLDKLLRQAYKLGAIESWEYRDGSVIVELCTRRLAVDEESARDVIEAVVKGLRQEEEDISVLIRRAKDRDLIRSAEQVGTRYRIEVAEASFVFEREAAREFLGRLLTEDRHKVE